MSAMEMFVQPASIQLQARQFRLQGRLRQAAATYEQLAQMQVGPEGTLALVHPGYCFGLGELCYEWNDLDTAERLLEQGREAFVYVNNHFAGHSPASARDMQRLLGQLAVEPEQLGEQMSLF